MVLKYCFKYEQNVIFNMEWLRSSFTKEPSKSYEESNGLINYMPLEILTYILSFTDKKSILNCSLVCKEWNEIIKSYYLWKLKCDRRGIKAAKHFPWYIYYALLYGEIFNKNHIKNGCGQLKFKGWKITENGGDQWKVEETPQGADLLPQSEDFEGNLCCYATSYSRCEKYQTIYFKNKLHRIILDNFQPKIILSEWFSGRFDCGAQYMLTGTLLDSKNKVIGIKTEQRSVIQWAGREWSKVEIVFENYGPGVAAVRFMHHGVDTQYWAGHYGMKMSGAAMRILLEKT